VAAGLQLALRVDEAPLAIVAGEAAKVQVRGSSSKLNSIISAAIGTKLAVTLFD
jgi:hypothetical protein